MKIFSKFEWMKQFDPLLKEQKEIEIKASIVLTDENFHELTNAAFKIKDSIEILSSGKIGEIVAINLEDETLLVRVGGRLIRLDIFDIKHSYGHFREQNYIWRIADAGIAQWISDNINSVSNCGFRIGQSMDTDEVLIGYSDLKTLSKAFDLMYKLYRE